MADAPKRRELLCLTMLGYAKPGLSSEELCEFQVQKHAKLMRGLMEKYGILGYTVTHNTTSTRSLLPQIFDPHFVTFADHDFIVRYIFPDLDCFLKLKADPLYIERIKQDPITYSNRDNKTRITLGWVHELVREGKIVYAEDDEVAPCGVNERVLGLDEGAGKSGEVVRSEVVEVEVDVEDTL